MCGNDMSAVATPPVPATAPAGFLRRVLTRFGYGAASLSLSQIVKRLFRFATLLIVGRLLGPLVFGEYMLLLTVVELIALVTGVGYVDLLARDVSRDHGLARRLFLRLSILRLALIPVAGAALLLILSILRYSRPVVAYAGLLLLTLVPRTINEGCQGVLKGKSRFARLVWIEILQGISLATAAVVLVHSHADLRAIIYAELFAAVVGAVAAIAVTAELLSGPGSSAELPPLRNAFTFNVYPLVASVYDRADIIILSKLAGDFAVGIYGIPYRIFSTLTILPYGLMGVLLPRYARATWNADSEARCRKLLQALYSAALVLILALWFIAPSLLIWILGAKFLLSAIPLRILIWATIPMFLNFGLNTILLASGREKVFMRTAAICTVVNVIANLLLVPRFSFVAAAAVTVLTECVLLLQNLFLLRGIIGKIPVPGVLIPTSTSFVAVVLAALALQHAIPQPVTGILSTSVFALISYFFIKREHTPVGVSPVEVLP
jgi:O-antigen/teichoic acid export membrane protein